MKLDAVKFKFSLGAVRSAGCHTGVKWASGETRKENAIEISYLFSENIFGLVEAVTEVWENYS